MKATSSLTDDVVARLRKLGSKKVRDGLLRFGIPNDNAFGVSVGKIQKLGKELGRDHELEETCRNK